MATTINLSLSPNYVQDWTYVEAIREITQNALDQQTLDPSNSMTLSYDESSEALRIASQKSMLSRSSLLIGRSTKQDDTKTIGKFGEGYKLALLVLTREGLNTAIYNYGTKETWTPKFHHSKQYDAEVLAVTIRKHIFSSVPNSDLTFVIEGITPDMYQELVNANLQLATTPYEVLHADQGDILLDESQIGRLYVSGLYVDTLKHMRYGYNIKPEHLSLDRDRKTVRSFDLFWLTSNMWSQQDADRVVDMLSNETPDIQYLTDSCLNELGHISLAATAQFKAKHGNSIPVTNQDDYDSVVAAGGSARFVSQTHYNVLARINDYRIPEEITDTPAAILTNLLENDLNLTESELEAFNKVLELSYGWR